MISVGKLGSAGDAASYYAKDNYYTADQHEGSSSWAGQGAEELGLTGPVDAAQFEKVLAGELPNGVVLDAARGEHRPGWDMTMSASKSVSLLALVGGDKRLVDAVIQASRSTLGWVERNLAEARVMSGKRQEAAATGNLVAATFVHDVNRCNEPQAHVHAVIANATKAPDGKWHALRSDALYNGQKTAGAVFNAELRARVEQLGYLTTPAQNPTCGAFEIAGVPRAVIDAFSTRSAEVDAYLKERGLEGTPRERELAVLATRDPKEPELAPEERTEAWKAKAAGLGLNIQTLVEGALARSGRAETVWTRAMRGIRGAGERGLAIAARMGLTPRDGDPLVPERLGRLDPIAFAAAQAVASAVRDLGEREAAFERLDLIRAALERGGPVTVNDIEARVSFLEKKGVLIAGDTRLLTTEMAQRAETNVLAMMRDGQGKTAPVVAPDRAGDRAQDVARELGLRPLNAAQQQAATLILSSADRTILVQGVSGAGKSAVLKPVARIAEREGRAVLGLAIAGTIANKLGRDTGAPAMTVAGFIAKHRGVIDGSLASAMQLDEREALAGALLLVDEASQIGTAQMSELLTIAERLGVGRVALIGDRRQLGAVEAGRPFAQAQDAGIATAELAENLRARSPEMKEAAKALNAGDIERAFEVLRPVTAEAPRRQIPFVAARMWASLPGEERDATLLLASGRAMRSEANAAAQVELHKRNELGEQSVSLTVLDRVTTTREGARQEQAYRPGHIVEVRTDLPSQGMARGDRGTVVSVERGQVVLRMTDGQHRPLLPGRLPRNINEHAISVFAQKEIRLHEGDRIRWTDNDHSRELLNAQLARVEKVSEDRITVSSLADGTVHDLARGDRMLERLDLAYAINAHIAQGVTTEHGIVMMSAQQKPLAAQSTFLVLVTRIAAQATLIVDSGRDLERAVQRNPGLKTAALDVAAEGRGSILPPRTPAESAAVAAYLQAYQAIEHMLDQDLPPMPGEETQLDRLGTALDRLRPHTAEDLRSALDRDPTLRIDKEGAGLDRVLAVLSEEQRLREDPAARSERFVADWKKTEAEMARAGEGNSVMKAEWRIDAMVERMGRAPELRAALDRELPDREWRNGDVILPNLPERSLGLDL